MDKTFQDIQESAVNAAIAGDWKKAVGLNDEAISIDEDNVDSYLRLGYAHMQLSNFTKAKKAYTKALRLQPGNQIAKNNLQKIKVLEKKDHEPEDQQIDRPIDPYLFINVMGKTKVVTLTNLGQADVLAKLKIGQHVTLKKKKRHVEVRTESGKYVGALPDDISKRLIYLIDNESEYSTYVKEALNNNVDVFIKENRMGRKVRKFVSFPKNIHDNLKMMMNEEENKKDDDTAQDEEDSDDTQDEDEAPVDLEQLAENIEEDTFYHEHDSDSDEDEEE